MDRIDRNNCRLTRTNNRILPFVDDPRAIQRFLSKTPPPFRGALRAKVYERGCLGQLHNCGERVGNGGQANIECCVEIGPTAFLREAWPH